MTAAACPSCGAAWRGRFHGEHAPHDRRGLLASCIRCGARWAHLCHGCGTDRFRVFAKPCADGTEQMRFECASCGARPEFTASLPSKVKRAPLRQRAVPLDTGVCDSCGSVLPASRLHVDHVIALAHGGRDCLDNTQILCVDCHAVKTHGEGFHRAAAALKESVR